MTSTSGLPPIVDTHAHLDDAAFDDDRDKVLAASRAAGVIRFINIGYRPASWDASRQLHERHPDVGIALGLHPGHADEYSQEVARALVQAIESMRPLAIGETGFDFSRSGPSFSEQRRSFQRQLEIAQQTRLPVIIHQREAADALIEELDRRPDLASIVLHSFDGNDRFTYWAI
jgi:TatD DNase family protein